jgi:2'-5' RNA ligase
VPRHRLGVVLLVPPPVAAEIQGLRRALGDGTVETIPPHVTLVPPVNVVASSLPDALRVLRTAASGCRPFGLELGPATTFHPVTPVVYLAVGGDLDALSTLRKAVFQPPLARPLSHDFVPHATLADDMHPSRIPAAVTALADYHCELRVDRVHILEQQDTGDRPWLPIADARLAPPSVVGRGGLELELAVTDVLDPESRALLGPAAPPLLPAPIHTHDQGRWAATARQARVPIAAAHGKTVGEALVVEALAVATPHRRQGVGAHLLAAIEAEARSRSLSATTITIDPDNQDVEAATALLAARGWHPDTPGHWTRHL